MMDSDFVALLSRPFYPSVEAKCTLGVAVCGFKEDLGVDFGSYRVV